VPGTIFKKVPGTYIKEFSMKKNLKIFGIIVLLAVIGLSMTGCPEEYTWKFINNSSYTVTVTCRDLDPSSFSIPPKETKTATSTLGAIYITYIPANQVDVESGSGKFTFTNKY
jgi:hypothetical protein